MPIKTLPIRTWLERCRGCCLLSGISLVLLGCALSSDPYGVEGYQTQQRIVWQGRLTVQIDEDLFRMVYFGYDRNGDMRRLTTASLCRGVDLLEYKALLPNGEWVYGPVLIMVDDNFDCYADRVLYDCDADGTFERVAIVPEGRVRLETSDDAHRKLIEAECLKPWK